MNKKNLLITGGAGFIGSCYTINQINAGHNVVVYDKLTYAGDEINLSTVKGKYHLVKADICDSDRFYDTLIKYDIDAVVNFAAESHVDNSINSPSIFIETNIIGTFKLLSASLRYYHHVDDYKKSNFRFLQVSTDEVYGSLGEVGQFNENSKIAPNSPYSASKASADLLVRAWNKTYNLPTIITNCSNNYGPRQLPEKLIPVIISKALAGLPIPIYGAGKNIRDWIHVEDHSNGIDLALNKGIVGETYCLGGNSEISNIDLANLICRILDELVPKLETYLNQIIFVADRPGHDYRYAINELKARSKLGFKQNINFKEGLKDTITWYLENKKWYDVMTSKLMSKAA